MLIFRSDEPYLDFVRHETATEKWLIQRPVCCRCNQFIQDDCLWFIHDDFYHEECAEDEFKRWTEDYIL